MKFSKLVLNGFKSLTVNKMRTGLAVLGIVIGIGSVIALVSMGEASKLSVQSQIQSIGSNLLTISPGAQTSGGVRGAQGGATTLTNDDAEAIKTSAEVTTVKSVSPEYSSRAQVIAGRNNTNSQIVGVEPAYVDVRKIEVTAGSFITDSQLTRNSKVAVLGPSVAEDLFGEGVNPIDQKIKINGNEFQVIGITKSKGGSGPTSTDDYIFVPLTTAQKQLFGAKHLTSIALEATSENVMTRAQNQVGYLLLARHGFSDPSEADFRISSQEDLLETITSVTGTFTTLLSGVAAISLLVGGIGIMNIMLMSVTERTREIGLRKALGAKKKSIIQQFLIESIILTFTGGVIWCCASVLQVFMYMLK
ncbi:ABC transporter permease [Candidatus Woesebacteria bacterium]|nr:ABC transporter permease [Candidatus Woesebacteria bacterium]